MLGQMPLGPKLIRGLIGFYLQRMKTTRVDGLRLTQSQKQRARALSSMIITPCCFTQPASVHGNNVAEAVKSSLRWLVAKNHTDKQITDAFVKAYGPHVLSIPPGYHLTLLPIGGAVLILLLVFVLIRRWSNREDEEGTKDDAEPSAKPEPSESADS
jgi:cytochrome c-type biogenesis protein CcmH/NrfF